jgi:hypothetical protein
VPAPVGAANESLAPAVLDYEDARAAGLDVEVPDGLPLCELDPDWPGYGSDVEVAEGEEIADATPVCAADPRLVEYVVGGPAPTSNHSSQPYHWNGQETGLYDYEGGKGQFRVKNAVGVPHQSGNFTEFVVGRILVKKSQSPTACSQGFADHRWAEAGWSEVSWSNVDSRRPYAWGTTDCTWRFFGQQYNLQDGSLYSWRVIESANALKTYFLWNNQWQLLYSYPEPDCSPNDCRVEAFIEVYSSQEGEHATWSGNADVQSLDLRSGSTFAPWDSSHTALVSSYVPYSYCPVTANTVFYVRSDGTC